MGVGIIDPRGPDFKKFLRRFFPKSGFVLINPNYIVH
jgi:hypothetical protein